MGRAIILTLAAVALGLFLFSIDCHRASPTPSQAFSLAPDFSLTDIDGQVLQLSAYRGRVVVLDFWATWCTPCRAEAPRFVELQGRYKALGLQVLGISMDDDAESVREFEQHLPANYPIAMGNAAVGELYGGILGLPVAFLIDRKGKIATKYEGPVDFSELDGRIGTLLEPRK